MRENISNSNTKTHFKDLNFFRIRFTKFVVYSLIILFSIILIHIVYYVYLYKQYKDFTAENFSLIIIYIALTGGLLYGLNKKMSKTKLLCLILLVGFSLRLIWALTTKSVPISDFKTMYDTANYLLEGDTSGFKGFKYFARFPHLIPYVLFLSQMIGFFGNSTLFVVKMINVFLSTSSIIFVYLICNLIFKDYKRTLLGTFFMAILPSSILYVPVYCSENVAIPFYLASIYCFILVINNKKNSLYLLLSGLLLCLGHLFRMVGYVILIAYVMYILIYDTESLKIKFRNILFILMPFFIIFIVFSNILIVCNITDRKLWSGSEPAITSVLKGSNIESGGRWSSEDDEFISNYLEDTETLQKASKELIFNRYTTTPHLELARFFIKKFTSQWGDGSNSGAYWSQEGIPENDIKINIVDNGVFWYQLVYIILLLLIIKGLFNNKQHLENRIINLFYIIFCGYGIFFLIIEMQARYAFIISFIFAILPVTAIRDVQKNNKIEN